MGNTLYSGREFRVILDRNKPAQHCYQLMLRDDSGEFKPFGESLEWQDFRRKYRMCEHSPHEECKPYWSNPYG
jgi:hypothetical protein